LLDQPNVPKKHTFRPIPELRHDVTLPGVRAYALAELGDRLALDVFIRREDAFAALEDAAEEERATAGMLFVAPIELDTSELSAN
jgi:hypothetical protein